MGTGNDPLRNPSGQHAPSQTGQKSGKGSGGYEDESSRKAQPGKGNPGTSSIHDAGQPDMNGKGQTSAGK